MEGRKVVINTCYGGFTLSEQAVQWLRDKGSPYPDLHTRNGEIPRHDPLLVQVVETLGPAAYKAPLSKLEVVTINEDKYRIDEYDGHEVVQTPNTIHWESFEQKKE